MSEKSFKIYTLLYIYMKEFLCHIIDEFEGCYDHWNKPDAKTQTFQLKSKIES